MNARIEAAGAGAPAPQEAAPVVSVVIPARNAADTLAATLDSLLAQTHQSWEALVVDDGSTDGTAQVAAGHAARDGRIRLIAGPGVGVSAARNAGLAEAQGRWLLFLDADDWIAPAHMTRLLAALAADPDAVLAYCRCNRVMPDGQIAHVAGTGTVDDDIFAMLARTTGLDIHSVIVECDVVRKVGGFDPSLRTGEDWDLWQRIARLGRRWVFVDEVLSFYRIRPGSLTRNLRQVLTDAEVVVRRAFAPDSRVPEPAPRHRDGVRDASGWSPDEVLTEVACWFGASAVGSGDDAAPAAEFLTGRPKPPREHLASLAGTIQGGLAHGIGCRQRELASRWPSFGGRLENLLARFGEAWADQELARNLQYLLERGILASIGLTETRALGLTLGQRLPLGGPSAIEPPLGVDRLLLGMAGRSSFADLGVLGPVSRLQLLRMTARHFEADRRALAATRALGRRAGWLAEVLRSRASQRLETRSPALARLLAPRPPAPPARPSGHEAALDALRREAEAMFAAPADADAPGATGVDWSRITAGEEDPAYWDAVFHEADPWKYTSPYEQEKYERQLALLPEGPVASALELACAEGHFTVQLAPRVERLLATDISTVALERAAARCRDRSNIEFRQLNLLTDAVPGGFDLVVCSEVLYFANTPERLAGIARKIAGALKPGGHLITAHARVLTDDPTDTAFDWPNSFGAETIARVLGDTPGLALERGFRTDLYRVDRFVRLPDGAARPAPAIEQVPRTPELEPMVEGQIIRGGAVLTRAEAARRERRSRIPVLMYHRIASDGPEALARYRTAPERLEEQLRWLRRHGFHPIDSRTLARRMRSGRRIPGRPVLLTFDDGFQDFADTAWPLLRTNGFTAEVFVVTGLAGKESEWDRAQGGAFPLMDPATLARLHGEGARFGSHLATHRAAPGLSTRDLAAELLQSRAALARWVGEAPLSLAAPYGDSDGRLRQLAAECGYEVCFGTHPGRAALHHNPLNVPRIEVQGDWSMDDFVACMEAGL